MKKGVYFCLWFQGDKNLSLWGGLALEQKAESSRANHKHKSEGQTSTQHQVFISKPTSSDILPSARLQLLNLPQAMTPTGGPVFKHLSLWGTL